MRRKTVLSLLFLLPAAAQAQSSADVIIDGAGVCTNSTFPQINGAGAVATSCLSEDKRVFLSGNCDLYGIGLTTPAEYSGYDSGLANEWERSWRDQDDALLILHRMKMRSYPRRSRYHTAGREWMQQYRRSAIFCDFYKPSRLHQDGAGVRATFGTVDAHLHVDALRDWSDAKDAQVGVLLGCVEAAFHAAIQSIGRRGQRHWRGAQLLNAAEEPVAVVDGRGIWLHRSAAFEAEIATLSDGVWTGWSEELALLAQTLVLQSARQKKTTPAVTDQRWSSTCEHLQIHGVISETHGTRGEPIAIFRLTRRQSPPIVTHGTNAFDLTSRQLSVARLIADGMSSAAIAKRLGVTAHTARRHTEVVLNKLNVRSRSSVARVLWGVRDTD